jgi:DNA-binding MarR family transcriptional regulator
MVASPEMVGPGWQDGLPHVLWRAQQAVHRRVQATLDDLGVTLTQLGLAVHLDELGLMSASDLSRRYHMTPQSVTTALSKLENANWVRRLSHPIHRRIVLYELTETGLAGVAQGRARMAEVDAVLALILPADGRNELIRLARLLTVALDGEDQEYEGAWPVVARPAPTESPS